MDLLPNPSAIGQASFLLDPYLLAWELDNGMRLELGTGTFGQVFRAQYAGRHVAVKRVNVTHVGEDRFFREVQLHFQLRDPQIVTVLGALVCPYANGKEHLVVMERLGGSLSSAVLDAGGALSDAPMKHRIRWLLEIAQGVRYLHAHKVVHADLKPGNILLQYNSNMPSAENAIAKVADFGFARIQRESAHLLRSSALGPQGTYLYMDPDLWEEGGEVVLASDIYSFGILAWELITGEIPFADIVRGPAGLAKLSEVVRAGRDGRAPARPSLEACTAALPPAMQAGMSRLVAACWSANRAERPSAAQVVVMLEEMCNIWPGDPAAPRKFPRQPPTYNATLPVLVAPLAAPDEAPQLQASGVKHAVVSAPLASTEPVKHRYLPPLTMVIAICLASYWYAMNSQRYMYGMMYEGGLQQADSAFRIPFALTNLLPHVPDALLNILDNSIGSTMIWSVLNGGVGWDFFIYHGHRLLSNVVYLLMAGPAVLLVAWILMSRCHSAYFRDGLLKAPGGQKGSADVE